MENLIKEWGFTEQVCDELKKCHLTLESLLDFKEADLEYTNLRLPPNTLKRLLFSIDQYNIKNHHSASQIEKQRKEQLSLRSPSPPDNFSENFQHLSLDLDSVQEEDSLEFERFRKTNSSRSNQKNSRAKNNESDNESMHSFDNEELYFDPPLSKKPRLDDSIADLHVDRSSKTPERETSNKSNDACDKDKSTSRNKNINSRSYSLRSRKEPSNNDSTSAQSPEELLNNRPSTSRQIINKKSKLNKNQTTLQELVKEKQPVVPPIPIVSRYQSFTSATRLNPLNLSVNSLRVVIEDSLEGQIILDNYNRDELLCDSDRNKLVSIIVNRCEKRLPRPVHLFFGQIAEGINLLMPNENIEIYYIPPYYNGSLSRNPKGKLTDRYKNIQYKLNAARAAAEAIEENNHEGEVEVEDLDANMKACKEWLKVNSAPNDEVRIHWQSSHQCRIIDLKTKSFDEIFNVEWPLLKSAIGPELLDIDFYKLYPDSRLAVEKHWEEFFTALFEIKQKSLLDPKAKQLRVLYLSATDSSQPNSAKSSLDGIRLLLLPYMIPIKRCVKTPIGPVKFTYQESSDGFVLWVKEVREVTARLKLRENRYTKLKLKVQPVIVIVGTKLSRIETCFVSLHDKLWEIKNPMNALSVTFKLLMLTNTAYPEDCAHIWLTIQKMVFKISTEFDQSFSETNQIINDLKVKIKS